MKRILLTGGTGFVGANLARRLLHDGHELHLLARPRCQMWRIEALRADLRLHATDLCDRDGVAAVVRMIRPDWVFHLAAYGAYPAQQDLQRMIETNFLAT